MTDRGKAAGSRQVNWFRKEDGFTLMELITVVIIIGFMVGIATLELRSTNTTLSMRSAVEQVKRSLVDAYSIAQHEKVLTTVFFYSNADADANKKNCYEVRRGNPGVSMKPPIGLRYNKVEAGGNTYYYVKMLDSGTEPRISAAVTVIFKPMGSATKSVDGAGSPVSQTITLTYTGQANRTLTVNSEGEVSP